MDVEWSLMFCRALLDAFGCLPRLSTGAQIEVDVACAMRLALDMLTPYSEANAFWHTLSTRPPTRTCNTMFTVIIQQNTLLSQLTE